MDDGGSQPTAATQLAGILTRMVPAPAVVFAAGPDENTIDPSVAPEDITDPDRMRRFDRGRTCASRALSALGSADVDVGRGSQREPIWPPGFVGSITHAADASAAAVASASHLDGIGIDVEPHAALPSGVDELVVAHDLERSVAARPDDPDVEWATILFSAKECVYKAWFPMFGSWLDFGDVVVALSPRGPLEGEWRVSESEARPLSRAQHRFVGELRGRYEVDSTTGLVITAVVLPASGSG